MLASLLKEVKFHKELNESVCMLNAKGGGSWNRGGEWQLE